MFAVSLLVSERVHGTAVAGTGPVTVYVSVPQDDRQVPDVLGSTRAAAEAVRALQIDPNSSEAHAALGYVRHYQWQWAEAENAFLRAIELNPRSPLFVGLGEGLDESG